MNSSKTAYNWQDPMFLNYQLTEEERMIRDTGLQDEINLVYC